MGTRNSKDTVKARSTFSAVRLKEYVFSGFWEILIKQF